MESSDMSDLKLSNGKRKLVGVLVGEIWMLANGGLNEIQAVKRLERLSAAAFQLQKQLNTGLGAGQEQSLPVCLAIKEEIDEISNY